MSCGYCENFDPNSPSPSNDKKEGWYGRPSGMQYELNQYVGSPQGPNAGPKSVGGVFFDEMDVTEEPSYVIPTPTPSPTEPLSTIEPEPSPYDDNVDYTIMTPEPTPGIIEGWYNMISGSQYEMNSHVSGNSGPGWGPKHAISGCINMILNPFVILLIIIIIFILYKRYKKF